MLEIIPHEFLEHCLKIPNRKKKNSVRFATYFQTHMLIHQHTGKGEPSVLKPCTVMHDFNLTATEAIKFLGDLQPPRSRAEMTNENVALQRSRENIAAISCSFSRLWKRVRSYSTNRHHPLPKE